MPNADPPSNRARPSERPPGDDQEAPAPAVWHEPPTPPPIPEILARPVERPAATPKNPAESDLSGVSRAWGVAMDFVFTILGSLLLGYFADRWLNTSPRWTLVGMVVGFTLALVRIIRRTLADERREKQSKKS